MSERVFELIAVQQKGKEHLPEYCIGEQLKDIALCEPKSAELLEKDLETAGMSLSDAANYFKEYADKAHGKEKCFCITPAKAEELLREFYGLPKAGEVQELTAAAKANDSVAGFVNLEDFL